MPPTQPRYASGGEAQEASDAPANPIGLYRQNNDKLPGFGSYVGVLDPIQGDAAIRQGYELIEEGRDAALKSQKDLQALSKSDKSNPGDE